MLSDQVPIVTACSFDLTRSNFFDIPKTKDARFVQFRFWNELSISIRSIDVQTLNECLDRFSIKDKKSKSNDSTLLIVEDEEKEAKIDQDNESKRFMIEFTTEQIGLKFIEQKESVRSRTLFVHSVVANSEAERKSIQKGDCVCTVNGLDTTEMSFADAIALIRNTKRPFQVLFERRISVKRALPVPPVSIWVVIQMSRISFSRVARKLLKHQHSNTQHSNTGTTSTR